jgi:hypothetical protein
VAKKTLKKCLQVHHCWTKIILGEIFVNSFGRYAKTAKQILPNRDYETALAAGWVVVEDHWW